MSTCNSTMSRLSVLLLAASFAIVFAVRGQDGQRGLGGAETEKLTSPPTGKVYALCVGVRTYAGTGCPDLKYCKKDAEDLAAVFKSKYGYEVDTLFDEKADRAAILSAVEGYRNRLTWEDSFIFYFAGHGQRLEDRSGNAKDGLDAIISEGYFLPYATSRYAPETPEGATDREKAIKKRDAMRKSCIEYGDFVRSMNNFKARHVVVIFDSCYSGMATLATRAAPADGAKVPDTLQLAEYAKGSRCVISAGDELQQVPEFNERLLCYAELGTPPQKVDRPIEHGVFTYELLSAVKPAGVVRVGDVYTDVQRRVFTVLEKQNHPITRPLMNKFGQYTGQFLFIPASESEWASNTAKKWAEEAAARAMTLTNRGDSERKSRLESSANFWLAYRVTASMKPGDPKFAQDEYWKRRFEQTVAQAQVGDMVAAAAVFYMQAYGLGTRPDPGQAFTWAVKSAKADAEEGLLALGHALYEGIGGARNDNVASSLREQVQAEQTAAASFVNMIAAANNNDSAAAGANLKAFLENYNKSKEKSLAKAMGYLYDAHHGLGIAMEKSFETGKAGDVTGWIDELAKRVEDVRSYALKAKDPLYAKSDYGPYGAIADKCCKGFGVKLEDLRSSVGAGVGGGKQRKARDQFREIEAQAAMLEALAPHIDIDHTYKRSK